MCIIFFRSTCSQVLFPEAPLLSYGRHLPLVFTTCRHGNYLA
jgi:hypothetical protein